mmetsp:Transcript_23583/g.59955  ORF Transcript_23583/g.59955 Transcript_23583/m.59955 type:complete len:262 (+) Transcript_23583:106-891(+)|eukprot:CAMPEP_0183400008 /NCGR_PEP_ID=MMETSP0370-20130417/12318_1 /TAXON_ID=268820 /ORGANISM="Peridinium aciculiferum, Strain PAER-2" /LENGTH=261 /DNA_ID=CAMNT_0025581249 /DNA_START=98 /DNA_END=883 /DNA_ORIENTATION=-
MRVLVRHGSAFVARSAVFRMPGAAVAKFTADVCPMRSRALFRSCRAFSDTPRFDVFKRFEVIDEEDPEKAVIMRAARIKAEKIKRIVDEIMSLNLLEAAELCELCQEKLPEGDNSPVPGRLPFPNPMAMFPGVVMPPMPGFAIPMPAMPGGMPPAQPSPAAPPAGAIAPAAAERVGAPVEEEKKKEEKKKETYSVKLVSFDAAKKIMVVKEVRALTQLGLKEAKEFVESALPKVIKKAVPAADAEAMKEKLLAAGAEVVLE